MVKSKLSNLAGIVPMFALFSCVAPQAVVVEAAPAPKEKKVAAPAAPAVVEAPMPADEDDGLRGLDESMLALPQDSEFRATVPTAPKNAGDSGAVISSRPPTDPPPRPKSKAVE